jgi:hypothetical protein
MMLFFLFSEIVRTINEKARSQMTLVPYRENPCQEKCSLVFSSHFFMLFGLSLSRYRGGKRGDVNFIIFVISFKSYPEICPKYTHFFLVGFYGSDYYLTYNDRVQTVIVVN